MPCFGPLSGYRPKKSSSSKRLVFDVRKSEDGLMIPVPCGRCVGCRLERSRQWAMRCMHEKRLHNMSSFITLTYAPDRLPDGNTLVLRDLTLFFKRLRKVSGNGLRYYACGEYGDVGGRPHYHALLLNFDFDDRRRLSNVASRHPLFTSATLDKLWSDANGPIGFTSVGDVDFDSCAYVARYIMKKALGKDADETRYDPATGVLRLPEFTVMSRRPGIGKGYVDKYGSELLAHDSVVFNGREMRPPRFYDDKLQLIDPVQADRNKMERLRMINPSENTTRRLRVREVVSEAALKMKGRKL